MCVRTGKSINGICCICYICYTCYMCSVHICMFYIPGTLGHYILIKIYTQDVNKSSTVEAPNEDHF